MHRNIDHNEVQAKQKGLHLLHLKADFAIHISSTSSYRHLPSLPPSLPKETTQSVALPVQSAPLLSSWPIWHIYPTAWQDCIHWHLPPPTTQYHHTCAKYSSAILLAHVTHISNGLAGLHTSAHLISIRLIIPRFSGVDMCDESGVLPPVVLYRFKNKGQK